MKVNKKTFLKIIGITIPVLLATMLIAIILTQVVFTIKTSPLKVEGVTWDATDTIEYTVERFQSGTMFDYEHAWSFNGKLPSDDPNDFIDLYCWFEVKNTGYIDQYTMDATLKNAENYSGNILFVTDANAVMTSRVWRKSSKQACIILQVYIGNLDENQIRELISGLTLSVEAQGDYFGTRHRTVSFDTCDNVSIENVRSNTYD